MSFDVRRTLAAATEIIAGVGLHSGQVAKAQIFPAVAGCGIVIRHAESGQDISASPANVVNTSRCTILGSDDVTVQTVEHLLSALAGARINDAIIEVRGGEAPAMDGSAAPFLEAIHGAGIASNGGELAPLRIHDPRLLTADNGSTLLAFPASAFHATVVLDYPNHPWIGTQVVEFDSLRNDYAADIAPARTYGFLSEIAWLRERGLALGASCENGIALREDGYDADLRFADELARHKMLDLIGDLSLVGSPLAMRIIAIKPSHTLNCHFARLLVEGAAAIN